MSRLGQKQSFAFLLGKTNLRAEFTFVTDTSTMCVFDVACMRHRLNDDADWWCTPQSELEELNLGNVAFVGLGGDGMFSVTIRTTYQHRRPALC